MAKDITSMFSGSKKRPTLDLKPEESLVLSTDFNLFYKPEEEPEIAGMKEFTSSLKSFVDGTLTKGAIAGEYKEKELNYAEAKQDYELNKGRFREAVKKGDIDVTGNPYYLEHYKELTLNDWANQFADKLQKSYLNKGVIDDTRDGAFDSFYKAEMENFVKKNDLGYFTPLELETGFFKKTSSSRAIIENNHRQTQTKLIKGKFDEKVINNTFGVISKYKTMAEDGSIPFDIILNGIADELNVSISAIEGVSGDGTYTIDTIFKGIEGYISSTTDFDFAKKLISQLPAKLYAGNNSLENIGRIKKKTNDLLGLIIANETQDYKSRNDLATVQETREIIKTHQFLDKQPDDFDIMAWRNSADRTNTEIATSDKWIKAQSFDGGNSDNPLAMAEVHALIRAGKYEEADDLAEKYTIDLQIKKSSLQSLRTTTIPLYQSHKDKPIFNHPRYVEVMTAIRSSIQQTQKGGDKLQGVKAQQWIEETMLEWYDENYKNYIGKNAEFKKLFLKEFNENLLIIQSTRTGDGDGLLFTAFNYTSESSKMSIDTTFQKLDNEKAKLK
jgi:hypothetical protein|tara:strand:+ start:126 stop:1796 length:1671 start_codon:yes stop_codon:yes gene_type:complete